MNSLRMATLSCLVVAAILAMARLGPGTERPTAGQAKSESSDDGCSRTGCSGQHCADESIYGTCEWLPWYACFADATCERQRTGQCDWTRTGELSSCLRRLGHPNPDLAGAAQGGGATTVGWRSTIDGRLDTRVPACSSLSRPLCPGNLYCADDATDTCVPGVNAVDCPGVCILPPPGSAPGPREGV